MAIREAIEIVWKSKGARAITAESEKIRRSLGGFASQKLDGFVSIGTLGGFTALATGAGVAALELSKIGAESIAVDKTFKALSGSASQAEANLNAMQSATRGLVDTTTQQQLASKLLGLGIATNASELQDFTMIAGRLGKEFKGLDLASAVDELGLTLANNSIPRLDSFGISATKVKTRINELKESGLDANEAFRQAFFEEARITFDKLPPPIDSTTESLGLLNAQWENFISNVGVAVESSGFLSGAIGEVAEGFELFNVSMFGGATVTEEISAMETKLQSLRGQLDAFENSPMQQFFDTGNRGEELAALITNAERDLNRLNKKQQLLLDEEEERTKEIEEQNKVLGTQVDLANNIAKLRSGFDVGGFAGSFADSLRFDGDLSGIGFTSVGDDNDARIANAEELERAEVKAAREAERAWSRVQSENERRVNEMKSLIEGQLQPTLGEVWEAPQDGRRADEWARRTATLATQGIGSEWTAQLQAQFGGQSFWEPVAAAIQSGDDSAIRQAATDLLSGPGVSQLWDKELIKERVRNQLIEQNLRQELVDTIYAELAGEGLDVEAGATAAGAALPIATSLTGSIATSIPGAAAESGIGASLVNSMIADVKENKDGLNKLAKTILEGLGSGFADMIGISAEMFLESLVNYTAQKLGLNGGTGGETIP